MGNLDGVAKKGTDMIQNFIESLKAKTSNDVLRPENMRTTPRRYEDKCVVGVNGSLMPIRDWSLGGFLAATDPRLYAVGQEVDFVLKFKIRNMVLDIPHIGKIVRKTSDNIAVEFAPLTTVVKRRFQKIIDDSVANEFAISQS